MADVQEMCLLRLWFGRNAWSLLHTCFWPCSPSPASIEWKNGLCSVGKRGKYFLKSNLSHLCYLMLLLVGGSSFWKIPCCTSLIVIFFISKNSYLFFFFSKSTTSFKQNNVFSHIYLNNKLLFLFKTCLSCFLYFLGVFFFFLYYVSVLHNRGYI